MKNKFIILFLFSPFFVFSQVTIQGYVRNSLKKPLVAAEILVQDSTNARIINYAITNEQGKYYLEILNYQGLAFLTVQSMGYAKKVVRLFLPENRETLIKNFTLQTAKTLLKEVVIKAAASPIEYKKDTVTYNVNKFTNGSEEVVQDVLKKLPGIEVNDNGQISYQGKPIEKVLVEGDNLVGNNYKVLTKNLSADIIKKIQVIENYIENKNLKGITNSNKTVLNLQLKNNVKAKPYGNIGLSYGYKDFYNASINALGVNKKLKYYLLGTSNNIGINSGPNDYISLTTNTDEIKSLSYLTSVGYEFPNLKTRRVNFNHLYFGSSNLLVNVNKRLKIRNNLYLTKDRNLFNKINQTNYLLKTGGFTINEIQSLVREPMIGQGLLEIQYNITNHSDFDYKIKYRLAQTTYNGTRNTTESFFNESLRNKEQYVYQNINYTNRINKHNALLINAQYFYNQKAQDYNLIPFSDSLPFNSGGVSGDKTDLMQQNTIVEHRLLLDSKYMGVRGSSNYQLKINYEHLQQSLNSNLFFVSDHDSLQKVNNPYVNNGKLRLQDFEVSFQNKNIWKKWELLYGLSLHYKIFLYQDTSSIVLRNHSLFLSPLLGVNLKLGKSKISLNYFSERRFPSINDLYSGYLLTDYRTFSKGTNKADEIQTQSVMAGFFYTNFEKLITFYALLIYLYQNKTFGSRILINKNFTVMEKAISPGNRNLIFSSMVNKFIPFLYSTIKLNIQFSQMNYFNYVNQSEQRNNKMFSGEYKLELNSGWKKFFNFSAGVKYNFYRVRIEDSPVVSKTKNLIAHLNFIMNLSKKLRIVVQNDQFFYDIKTLNTKTYYFLDAKIKYTIRPNKFFIQLTGNNLLGIDTFNKMNISDYMVNTTQYNVLPRQVLLNVTFRF